MDELTIDSVYGQALFSAATDREKEDQIGEEYKAVTQVFSENPDLRKLFTFPTISAADKKKEVKNIFGGQISPELVNFICILIDKRHVFAWEGIGRYYDRLLDEKDGLTRGILYSVIPITGERLAEFEEKTSAAIGKKVKLENRIDESLIGGISIYIDGKLIDVSIKKRLEQLKQRIVL